MGGEGKGNQISQSKASEQTVSFLEQKPEREMDPNHVSFSYPNGYLEKGGGSKIILYTTLQFKATSGVQWT